MKLGVIAELLLLWHARVLLATMVRRELAARNVGSALGMLWTYVQPLALLSAYFLLFEHVLQVRVGAEGGGMGFYLVAGMVPWLAFSDAIGRGATSLVEAGGLLQKSALPLVLFPARAVLASLVVFLPFLLALALIGAGSGTPAVLVAALALLALQALLGFLCAYLLAVLVAAVRDVQQILQFVLAIGLFCSPILYPPSFLPETMRGLLWLNPITPFALAWQGIAVDAVLPGMQLWAVIAAWCAGLGVLLGVVLARAREQIVDWL